VLHQCWYRSLADRQLLIELVTTHFGSTAPAEHLYPNRKSEEVPVIFSQIPVLGRRRSAIEKILLNVPKKA
jgi:hypothetical protein